MTPTTRMPVAGGGTSMAVPAIALVALQVIVRIVTVDWDEVDLKLVAKRVILPSLLLLFGCELQK
jgi:hypothetical protein